MTRRQMARRVDAPGRRWPLVGAAVVTLVVVAALIGAMAILGGRKPNSSSPPHASPSVPSLAPGASPSPADASLGSAAPSLSPPPAPSIVASVTPPSVPPASATPLGSPSPAANTAPRSAQTFDLVGQAIDIGFPLRADTDYHYRDNWLEPRAGAPDAYNHAQVNAEGKLLRLHDGVDIYAPENEPVLSPFDGVVIDPATQWTPWEPDRYGLTVVVQSDEPTSDGYMAVLVHLDRVWVDIGQHVTRGQVIGVLGRTGNAEEVRPQLHFELRAPFLIDWTAIGEPRQVDAFNPFPSLVAADPKDTNAP